MNKLSIGAIIFILIFSLASICLPVLAQDGASITPTNWDHLGIVWSRLGQRVTLNGTIATLTFPLAKTGSPTGDVTFAVRRVSDDSIIVSEVWWDVSELTDVWFTWYEVAFDSPTFISEEVRLSCEWDGGNATDYVMYGYRTGSVATGESYTNYITVQHSWHDIGEAEEGAYAYTYGTIVPVSLDGGGTNIPAICISIAGVGVLAFVGIKRRHK
jgi:hypothetical protein